MTQVSFWWNTTEGWNMMNQPNDLKAAQSVRNISFERSIDSIAITGYWLNMIPAPLRSLHAPSGFAHGGRLSVSAVMVQISKCHT